MEKHHSVPFFDHEENDRLASSTDQTGLIPAAVEDEGEAEAYEELYPAIHRQKPV